MAEIIKHDGIYTYRDKDYVSADSVYEAYRYDYHKSLGKAVHNRLDRIGSRKERVHGFGFIFSDSEQGSSQNTYSRSYNCRLLGLMGICYVRTIGVWDYSDITDEEFDEWFDYVFSRGSGKIRTLGVNKKVGRTSKRLKTRYR